MERGLTAWPNDWGLKLSRAAKRVVNGYRAVLFVDPVNDKDLDGIIVRRPSSTVGTSTGYALGNAIKVLDAGNGDGTGQSLVRFRVTYDGAFGGTSGHIGPGLNSSSVVPTQALWIQNMVDTVGLVLTAHASQTTALVLVSDSAGTTTYLKIDKNGYIVNKKTAAIADGDLAASEAAWYIDATSGAPKVIFKGKDAGGTVFERTIGLSTPTVKSSGSQTATGSLTEDVLATITDPGRYVLTIDANAMLNADSLIVKIYGKARSSDTERIIDQFTFTNVQDAPLLEFPETTSPHHYKVSLACSAARAFPWAVYAL